MPDESKPPTPWDTADFYGREDQERLSHEDPDEMIEEYLDNLDASVGIEEAIRDAGPLVVVVYDRATIDVEKTAKSLLARFVCDTAEELGEEYGDPDPNEYDDGALKTEHVEAFEAVALPALRAMLSTVVPWRCEEVARRTYTEDELVAWARKNNPQWFEEGRR